MAQAIEITYKTVFETDWYDFKFDGGQLSSDGGLLLLRETEQRLQVAERLAACIRERQTRSLTVWPTSSSFSC